MSQPLPSLRRRRCHARHPFVILIARAFMIGIPTSIVEAARVDGVGLVRAFVSIVLLRTLQANDDVELAGPVDLNLGAAQVAMDEFDLRDVALDTSVSGVATETGAHAVVNVTVPAAHHPVNVEAMFAGLPVLCEKPVAPTVAEGLSLPAAGR